MCPISSVRKGSAIIIEKNTDVKPKPVVNPNPDSKVIEKHTIVQPPKDTNQSKSKLPDNFKTQVSFKGKIEAKTNTKKEEHHSEAHHSTADNIKHIAHEAHDKHTKYELAVHSHEIVSKVGKAVTNGGRALHLSGHINGAVSSSKVTKAAMQVVKGTGIVGTVVGKGIQSTANLLPVHLLHKAHEASQATQIGALKTTASTLSKVGAAKASAKVTSLIPVTAHAAHGATSTVKAVATVTKIASTTKTAVTIARTASVVSKGAVIGAKALGKVMPGVGFAAGMVGAGFAVNDAVNAKTTAGKVAHSARAVLSATAGVASFVPGVGTAVGLIATGAEIGIGYAAKKFGWN